MHPYFLCFEWATYEERRPHPLGESVVPNGPWENATLILRSSDSDVGEAWIKEENRVLFVDIQIHEANGGSDEWWVRHLLAETLLGSEGLVLGFYHSRTEHVRLHNFVTTSTWFGSWMELHGEGGKFELHLEPTDQLNHAFEATPTGSP
jgi:hypothetical protein